MARNLLRVSTVSVIAAATILAGCGSTGKTVRTEPVGAQSAPATTSSTTTSTSPNNTSNGQATATSAQRYDATFYARSGTIEVQPPPTTTEPKISANQAWQAFLSTGLFPKTARNYSPDIRFGLFTDHQYGTMTSDSGGNQAVSPTYQQVPAWVIRFTNVPDEIVGTGAAPPAGSFTTSTTGAPADVNILVVINADTGQYLEAIDDGVQAG